MTEYIVKLPIGGAAEEWFKKHECPNMTLYGYPLTGEIVRCRNCRHNNNGFCGVLCCGIHINGDGVAYLYPDFFCASGDRKEATITSATEFIDEPDTIRNEAIDSGLLTTDNQTTLVETNSYSNANEVIHVLECSVCGKSCEYVNGSYPKCPHCGRKARQ